MEKTFKVFEREFLVDFKVNHNVVVMKGFKSNHEAYPSMSIEELEYLLQELRTEIPPNAQLIWASPQDALAVPLGTRFRSS